MRSSTRRPLRLVALAAVVAPLALAGCTGAQPSRSSSAGTSSSAAAASSAPTSAAPLTCAPSGAASKAVAVSGKFGVAPKVTFATPLSTTATQRTTILRGTGAAVQPGDALTVGLVGYNARTGKQLAGSAYGTASVAVDPARYIRGLAAALDCTRVGDRFAAVVPAADAFGAAGSSTIGVKGGDSLVFVVDVKAKTPTHATGASTPLPSGFPAVKLAADGQPTVTIPKADPPKKLTIAESKTGTGAVVKPSDQVTVQYQGVLWRTGKVFDQSWGKSPATFLPSQVVPGFGKALVGHKVGSQVVAIIPPADGYGKAGQPRAGIKGTDTMVFVVDILAAASAG